MSWYQKADWLHYVGSNFGSIVGRCNCKKEYVYAMIPKNASMSFRNCGMFGPRRRVLPSGPKNVICIFREPVDRFISIFHWELRERLFHFGDLKAPTNFLFLEFLTAIERSFTPISAPQIEYLKHGNLDIEDIDVIMRVSHLQADFNKFKKRDNLAISLKKVNARAPDRMIEDFVGANPRVKQRICKLYKEDVELYGQAEENLSSPKWRDEDV